MITKKTKNSGGVRDADFATHAYEASFSTYFVPTYIYISTFHVQNMCLRYEEVVLSFIQFFPLNTIKYRNFLNCKT